MTFEVFATEDEMLSRAKELQKQGATVIKGFNGHTYTIKWK